MSCCSFSGGRSSACNKKLVMRVKLSQAVPAVKIEELKSNAKYYILYLG